MLKREKRPIHHALLKYGHENFTLEIIECCPISELLVREQYYLDLLKPDYNVLEFAYSSLGYRHSAETIALLKKKITPEFLKKLKEKKISSEHKEILSLTHKGKVVSQETRNKLSIATSEYKKNNPLSPSALANIRVKTLEREGVGVSVFNSQTNEVREFTNQTEAGEFIGVTRQAVYNAIKRGKKIKGIYLITKKAASTS
jgi:group I intron endonuclease